MGRLGIDAVKIHNLYCVKNTPLADQVARGEVRLMERAEYVRTVVDFIELLPPTMIVDRISGDAPPDYFIGPTWCLDKPAVKAGRARRVRAPRIVAVSPLMAALAIPRLRIAPDECQSARRSE